MYKYFVSYKHEQGSGRCEVDLKKKVKNINDIIEIEKLIKEKIGLESIVINYRLF